MLRRVGLSTNSLHIRSNGQGISMQTANPKFPPTCLLTYERGQSVVVNSNLYINRVSRKSIGHFIKSGKNNNSQALVKTKQNTRDWKLDEEKQIWPTGEGKNCTVSLESLEMLNLQIWRPGPLWLQKVARYLGLWKYQRMEN